MLEKWENVKVNRIDLCMYVFPNTGNFIHNNRPSHGLVLNDADSCKDYYFSDGNVLKTKGGELFYLPKGSDYVVKSEKTGGCYAINFDSDFECAPFTVELKNSEKIIKLFAESARIWKSKEPFYEMTIYKNIYEIILSVVKEQQRAYMPKSQEHLILPAVEKIKTDFTQKGLSISELCELCGISETYFRRIFVNKFGVSPKEFIINKRVDYAKQLLSSGQFSVNETAQLCGYAEECHFSREFTKRTGVNPKDFKGDLF